MIKLIIKIYKHACTLTMYLYRACQMKYQYSTYGIVIPQLYKLLGLIKTLKLIYMQ